MRCNPVDQVAGLYERIGGEPALRDFVGRLYRYMDVLPEVKPVRDMHHLSLDEAGDRLFRFLSGWLGGPPLYHRTYGEPRLRRRHLHISIGDSERDQWLLCARKALDDMHWPVAEGSELMERLHGMADHLRNQGPFSSGCGVGCRPHRGL
jgi:hemoglobin